MGLPPTALIHHQVCKESYPLWAISMDTIRAFLLSDSEGSPSTIRPVDSLKLSTLSIPGFKNASVYLGYVSSRMVLIVGLPVIRAYRHLSPLNERHLRDQIP